MVFISSKARNLPLLSLGQFLKAQLKMLFFSSKVGLAALQMLLNVQVTSLKIYSVSALFVTLRATIIICIFPEVKFYIFLLLETYLETWQFSPPFLFNLDSACFTTAV